MSLVFDFRPSPDRPADRVERERLERLAACYHLFVGHELPNTLVALQGMARMLADLGDRIDDEARECLGRLAVLAQRADVASRRLAEFGRLLREPAVGHPIDPAEVIREAVAEVNARLSGPPIAVATSGPLPRVTASRPLLYAVLVQLLANAAQAAMPDGPRAVEITCWSEAGGAWLTVRDQGRGMSEGQLRLLEEPFAAGRQPGAAGAGLGFFLVSQAAARWAGVVRVTTAPGAGTAVELFLPTEPNTK